MRKIIVLTFLTLDGVMQAPGGPKEDTSGNFKYGGWTAPYFDESAGKIMGKQMEQPFELLLGKKTFEIFAGYWPKHGDGWPGINEVRKYVVSETITKHQWNNSVFLNGIVVEKLKKLKKEKGPDLKVYGSGKLVQTLLKNELVDELWLKIFPITLGKGKKLFSEGTIPVAWKLLESKILSSGVIFVNYKRSGKVKTGSLG